MQEALGLIPGTAELGRGGAAGRGRQSDIQDGPQMHGKSEASLDYMGPSLKQTNTHKQKAS